MRSQLSRLVKLDVERERRRASQKQLEALREAYRQGCRGLNFLKVDPAYDGVRNDESFREVIARMRL